MMTVRWIHERLGLFVRLIALFSMRLEWIEVIHWLRNELGLVLCGLERMYKLLILMMILHWTGPLFY